MKVGGGRIPKGHESPKFKSPAKVSGVRNATRDHEWDTFAGNLGGRIPGGQESWLNAVHRLDLPTHGLLVIAPPLHRECRNLIMLLPCTTQDSWADRCMREIVKFYGFERS